MVSFSSIVLLGNFNPAIFHPAWLEKFKILPIQETQWALGEKPKTKEFTSGKEQIIIQEVPPLSVKQDKAHLQFLSLRIMVEPNRFICNTVDRTKFTLIKEVVLKIFEILNHTPITGIGINFDGHLEFKDPCDKILKDLFAKRDADFSKIMGDDYKITGRFIFFGDLSKTTLKLEPSNKLENGISYNINFHRDVKSQEAEVAMELLREHYSRDMERITKLMKDLLGDPIRIWTQ